MDLVIPREAVASLRVPAVSLTDGEPAEPVTVRPWRSSLVRRSAAVALPFGRQAAERVRKAQAVQRFDALVLGPASLITVVCGAVAHGWYWWKLAFSPTPYAFFFGFCALHAIAQLLDKRLIPPQYPRQGKRGDLLVREVPQGVAEQWMALDPRVRSQSPRD
ncbi:hypothetical protein [Micromonospora rosaria]|uniref:hypothetical protein n=1 Tax=Micromonospora rosaria TaxID=47874 RepID=UPI001FE1C46E|nr:hypothetical protein [Micromonospora rosaria]